MKFCVYVDYTKEEQPRAYYVGKGSPSRVLNVRRNRKHAAISAALGLDRRIVVSTDSEELAFSEERRLVSELHTFVADPLASDIASNMTTGGAGLSGINRVPIALWTPAGDRLTFESTAAAAQYLGVAAEIVGRLSTSSGRKAQEIAGHRIERLGLVRAKRQQNHRRINCTQVIEFDLDGNVVAVHDSVSDAARAAGVSRAHMSAILSGRRPSSTVPGDGRRSWARSTIRERPGHSDETRSIISRSLKGRRLSGETKALLSAARSKCVHQINDEGSIVAVFVSASAAQRHLGISKSTMLNIIRASRVYDGCRWRYAPAGLAPIDESSNPDGTDRQSSVGVHETDQGH